MSITAVFDGALSSDVENKSGLSRFVARVIRAREMQAQRQVAQTLLKMDDVTLAAMGRSRAALKRELSELG
ncbi:MULTISPECIES: hypothetical protein [Pseudovibrio]|uniref:hypothetical protein n=1 Tax=Stappiaceae TaxID=2821832 RepID=UPI0023661EC0|nr:MULTISPECIES: hypothetical protein [Pseudovibrio]MDD7910923.1 hypothetical protein [Pseudovibrio exalbescens]MDX5593363.1 hypothetical protein [Pseudovibrio sp. SPO723]